MPFLSTTHHDLYYVTQGDSTQPPLLLLHGFLGNHQDFIPLVATLSRHFYCITVDLPGHGKTRSHPNGYTFPATAQSLLALLNHLNIRQTHLLGYSMGGRIALYLACEFPDCFLRVVLESASPGLRTAEARKSRRESDSAIAHCLQTTSMSSFLTQWYHNPLFASLKNHPEVFSEMLQRRENNNSIELSHALKGLGTGEQPSLWEPLTQVRQPLLLIVGALDAKFIAINGAMKALLEENKMSASRTVKLKTIKTCGHNIHLEAPAAYALTVLSFFDDII
ncbi:MAG: 2-succinyl-6-hydroxy-2,4-cyclohexadiene-1-carboxylate synthase [Cyanobacteria bacterium J06621_11]